MRNSIIGENDCKRAISHETNPSPIKWWFWKGNCLARVMDSVSAVMTHVTRESWDPGPGPYRQSKAAAQPHWELPQDVLWMAKGWPIAPPPPKGCRAEHRVSREPFHLAGMPSCHHFPPTLPFPKKGLVLRSKYGNSCGPQPHGTLYYFLSFGLCFLFPRTIRSHSTDSIHHWESFSSSSTPDSNEDDDNAMGN